MTPFCFSSQPPHLPKPGEWEGNVSFSEMLVSPRLWILKRRILFHTLPNLRCLPRLSPYLLFLPLLDDYFLSSSLFFFPLVLSCLCCSGFTIWFCSPYRSPSLCHNPRFPLAHLPHPCFSSPFHSLLSCLISPKVFKGKPSQGQLSLPACC